MLQPLGTVLVGSPPLPAAPAGSGSDPPGSPGVVFGISLLPVFAREPALPDDDGLLPPLAAPPAPLLGFAGSSLWPEPAAA
jgi:hypothetical protein